MTTDISDISEKMEDENSEQFMMDFFNMAGFGGTDFAEMSERMGKRRLRILLPRQMLFYMNMKKSEVQVTGRGQKIA